MNNMLCNYIVFPDYMKAMIEVDLLLRTQNEIMSLDLSERMEKELINLWNKSVILQCSEHKYLRAYYTDEEHNKLLTKFEKTSLEYMWLEATYKALKSWRGWQEPLTYADIHLPFENIDYMLSLCSSPYIDNEALKIYCNIFNILKAYHPLMPYSSQYYDELNNLFVKTGRNIMEVLKQKEKDQ